MGKFSIEVREFTLTRVETGRGDGKTYWQEYPHTRAYLGERSLQIVCMATGAFVASVARSRIVSFMRCPAPASLVKGCPHPFCSLNPSPMILPDARHMAGRSGRGQDAVAVAPGRVRKPSSKHGWISRIRDELRRLVGAGAAGT